jgi:hypothetical protein
MRIFVLALCLACALALVPFADLSEPIKDAKCMIGKFKVYSLQLLLPNGKVDPAFAKNVALLKGAASDVYIGGYAHPCMKCPIPQQVAEIKKAVDATKVDTMVSIMVDGPWTANQTANVIFLKDFWTEYQKVGLKGAIISHEVAWRRIMGPSTDFKDFLLWWINHDNKPDNASFKPFGGWTKDKVVAKQYTPNSPVCDIKINLDSQYF